MKHLLARELGSSAAVLSERTYARFLKETLPIYKREGLSGVSQELLKRIGIGVDIVQEQNPEFLLMRNRLTTKPGLIISNHPGYIDVPVVLQAIKRTDIKIMVTEKRHSQFTELYGDHFVSAAKNTAEAKKNINKTLEHIRRGGAFLLFPSGEVEARGGSTQFHSGIRAVIEKLPPETMLYAFHVSPNDIRAMIEQEKSNPMARIVRIQTRAHPAPRFHIRLNEAYTTCGEWQKRLSSTKGSIAKNRALTEQYYQLFN